MSKKDVIEDFRYERGAGWLLRHDVCSMCGAKRPAAKGFEPAPGAAAFAGIGGLENGIHPHPPVFFVRISIHGSCWLIFRKDIILQDFWMRLSFFRKNWCTAWFFVVREVTVARQSRKASVIGFMLRSDTLLFYRMVQAQPREMQFSVSAI